MSADYLPVLDPVTSTTSKVPLTVRDSRTEPATGPHMPQPSPYWGDEPIWNSKAHVHNPMFDETEFNAETIAEEVGMSKASLYKKVKTITSLTPHGLIKQYRLKRAADLLRNSGMSVSEVIFETGFNSRSYFYKSFNEMFHCHPKSVERAATNSMPQR